MRYKKYIVLAFLGALFLPLLSAKSDGILPKEENLEEVVFHILQFFIAEAVYGFRISGSRFDAFNRLW